MFLYTEICHGFLKTCEGKVVKFGLKGRVIEESTMSGDIFVPWSEKCRCLSFLTNYIVRWLFREGIFYMFLTFTAAAQT
jgi:hypothetical protein